MSRERVAIKDGRKPGWHWAAHEIIDGYGAELGPYGLALYYALCRHANQEGESWPSYATLAKETGMSRAHARETMKHLVELELVSKKARKDEAGDATSNLYTLLEVLGGGQPRGLPRVQDSPQVGNDVPQGRQGSGPKQELSNKTHFEKDISSIEGFPQLKIQRLEKLGINDPKRSEIAQYRDLSWIESARHYVTQKFKDPDPAAMIHLHDIGWEPEDYEVLVRPYVLARIERMYGADSPMLAFYKENYGIRALSHVYASLVGVG